MHQNFDVKSSLGSGVQKSFHPTIRDWSTWSKFRAREEHGEHGKDRKHGDVLQLRCSPVLQLRCAPVLRESFSNCDVLRLSKYLDCAFGAENICIFMLGAEAAFCRSLRQANKPNQKGILVYAAIRCYLFWRKRKSGSTSESVALVRRASLSA